MTIDMATVCCQVVALLERFGLSSSNFCLTLEVWDYRSEIGNPGPACLIWIEAARKHFSGPTFEDALENAERHLAAADLPPTAPSSNPAAGLIVEVPDAEPMP